MSSLIYGKCYYYLGWLQQLWYSRTGSEYHVRTGIFLWGYSTFTDDETDGFSLR